MRLTEDDIIARVGITEVRLRTWVSRGWLCPAQSEAGFIYTELDVARCNLIREFRDDLEIDRETLPIVLRLLDQIYGLRRELRTITRAIEQQPDEVRATIIEMVNATRHGAQPSPND